MPRPSNPNNRDLIRGPIPALVRDIAIPASVGFFFYTMYNTVDTWYAGRISTTAQAALGLALPVFFLIVAAGSGLSVGTTALIGTELGAGRPERAAEFAVQGMLFGLLASALLCFGGLALSPTLFRFMGASDAYLNICMEYITPIFYGAIFFLTVYMSNAVLQAEGDTRPNRNFLIVSFFLNCLLDPWFISGGLGVPAMGVRGVAVATTLIQALGAVYLAFRASRTGLLRIDSARDLIPRPRVFLDILRQGLPATINFMTVGMGMFVINAFVSRHGQAAVAAYGIGTRVEQIMLMPTIGLNVAVLSVVAQNAGAGRFDRIREVLRTALRYGGWVMGAGTVLVFALAPWFMDGFSDDPEVIAIGTHYLRIAAFILYAYVVLFVSTAALQGVKRPMFAIWIGLFRQIAAPLAVFTLLSEVFGLGISGIWWGILSITWFSAGIAIVYARRKLAAEAAADGKSGH